MKEDKNEKNILWLLLIAVSLSAVGVWLSVYSIIKNNGCL